MSRRGQDPIFHVPVLILAFVPHAGKLRMTGFDIVVDANIALAVMLPVQPAGVLLNEDPAGDFVTAGRIG